MFAQWDDLNRNESLLYKSQSNVLSLFYTAYLKKSKEWPFAVMVGLVKSFLCCWGFCRKWRNVFRSSDHRLSSFLFSLLEMFLSVVT